MFIAQVSRAKPFIGASKIFLREKESPQEEREKRRVLDIFWCLGPESNRYSHEDRGILSPLRLPIPPPRHLTFFLKDLMKLSSLNCTALLKVHLSRF